MQKITREEIQEKINESRQRLLAALDGLPEEAIEKPNVIGQASIRDYLCYLAVWQEEFLIGLREIQRRKKPTKFLRAIENRAKFKQYSLNAMKKFDYEGILIELDDAHIQIEDQLLQINYQDLNEPKRINWLGNKPLWPFIARNTYEHDSEMLPTIEAFSTRWKAENSTQSG